MITEEKAKTTAVAKKRKKPIVVEKEDQADFWEGTDYEVHSSYLGDKSGVVVFSQDHGGSVGDAIIGILENIHDGSVQQLITDTNHEGVRYYTLILGIA
jgi:hypothetical protein